MMSLSPTIVQKLTSDAIEQVLIGGDLEKLKPAERIHYYKSVCESLGLNPLTKPFDYIKLNGKLTLYANKGCTDQLRSIRKVSIQITSREKIGDVYVVTAKAKLPDGREDESTGAVSIANLRGDNLANAFLKAETKAKRRVTLSACGLGMLDESEVDSIKDARPVSHDEAETLEQIPAPASESPKQEPPWEEDDPGEYVVPRPLKHAGLKIKEIGKPELLDSINYWYGRAQKAGKKAPDGKPGEFVSNAEAYLESLEAFQDEPWPDEVGR